MKNINKLIEQATTTEEYGWGASYEQFDKEKFAKLVSAQVRKRCIDLVLMGTGFPVQTKTPAIIYQERERIADLIRAEGIEDMFEDDTDAGGDMFFDFLKVVLAIFGFVLLATALGGIVWWIMI